MGQVIFNHYVNECRTYFNFSQRVLHGVLRSRKEKNALTLPHSAQRKHAFIGKIMEKSKKKITSKE